MYPNGEKGASTEWIALQSVNLAELREKIRKKMACGQQVIKGAYQNGFLEILLKSALKISKLERSLTDDAGC